jgi:hypothetical protein
MSDEQRTEEEADVEGHSRRHSVNVEPAEEVEGENDVEAHIRYDKPKKD